MRYTISLVFALAFFPGLTVQGQAQADEQARKEVDFVFYLIGRGDIQESLYLLDRVEPDAQSLADTVLFLKGWMLYGQKDLLTSSSFLLNVSGSSPLFAQSRFFGAYNLAHEGLTARATEALSPLSFEPGSVYDAMKNFQLAGLSLLRRDFDGFSSYAEGFSGGHHLMAEEEARLLAYRESLLQAPVRSPFMAGLLSAAVPGLGKVYAGKTAEGIAGFIYVAAMGATAWDFYRGAGPRSALFILSASITGVFYLGNIFGSATAVRRQQNELNHEMDQRILFDMHIPLRNTFN